MLWVIFILKQTFQVPPFKFAVTLNRDCSYDDILTIASIWRENMLGYLSVDIICSERRTVFREKTCELRGTDNVYGQISDHILAPDGGRCVYYPSNLFRNSRSFENWGIFGHVTFLVQSRASENI